MTTWLSKRISMLSWIVEAATSSANNVSARAPPPASTVWILSTSEAITSTKACSTRASCVTIARSAGLLRTVLTPSSLLKSTEVAVAFARISSVADGRVISSLITASALATPSGVPPFSARATPFTSWVRVALLARILPIIVSSANIVSSGARPVWGSVVVSESRLSTTFAFWKTYWATVASASNVSAIALEVWSSALPMALIKFVTPVTSLVMFAMIVSSSSIVWSGARPVSWSVAVVARSVSITVALASTAETVFASASKASTTMLEISSLLVTATLTKVAILIATSGSSICAALTRASRACWLSANAVKRVLFWARSLEVTFWITNATISLSSVTDVGTLVLAKSAIAIAGSASASATRSVNVTKEVVSGSRISAIAGTLPANATKISWLLKRLSVSTPASTSTIRAVVTSSFASIWVSTSRFSWAAII